MRCKKIKEYILKISKLDARLSVCQIVCVRTYIRREKLKNTCAKKLCLFEIYFAVNFENETPACE